MFNRVGVRVEGVRWVGVRVRRGCEIGGCEG